MRVFLVSLFCVFANMGCISKQRETNWGELASLQTSRSEISAAVIDNNIFVAGGIGLFRTLKSCEKYSHRTSQWSECPDLPHPLHHVALASDGNSVYASGGYASLRFKHDDAPTLWQLDLQANEWIAISQIPERLGELLKYGNKITCCQSVKTSLLADQLH